MAISHRIGQEMNKNFVCAVRVCGAGGRGWIGDGGAMAHSFIHLLLDENVILKQ